MSKTEGMSKEENVIRTYKVESISLEVTFIKDVKKILWFIPYVEVEKIFYEIVIGIASLSDHGVKRGDFLMVMDDKGDPVVFVALDVDHCDIKARSLFHFDKVNFNLDFSKPILKFASSFTEVISNHKKSPKMSTEKEKNAFSEELVIDADPELFSVNTGIPLIDKRKWFSSPWKKDDDRQFQLMKEKKIKYRTYRFKTEYGPDILFRYLD